ncbi:hypothetical protein VTK73DRAFT_8449 [Phialemonium thermophilum]|uniref:Uncharacterized protein n=1 Tax=Phialemonium thermophilum TaxID=223376 RepID=A0ABR3W8M0_9PEZI
MSSSACSGSDVESPWRAPRCSPVAGALAAGQLCCTSLAHSLSLTFRSHTATQSPYSFSSASMRSIQLSGRVSRLPSSISSIWSRCRPARDTSLSTTSCMTLKSLLLRGDGPVRPTPSGSLGFRLIASQPERRATSASVSAARNLGMLRKMANRMLQTFNSPLSLDRLGSAWMTVAVAMAARSSMRAYVPRGDARGRFESDSGVPGRESGRMWWCSTWALISSTSSSSRSRDISPRRLS